MRRAAQDEQAGGRHAWCGLSIATRVLGSESDAVRRLFNMIGRRHGPEKIVPAY